jgi:aromatase
MTQLSTREPGTREVTHEVSVDAPAAAVYQLIADIENWPLIFPPTVHVAKIESTGRQELIRIWATANGEAKNWTSRRSLYPAQLRIEFHQEVSTPPVAAMAGTWVIEPVGATRSKVHLLHEYRAVDDDPDNLAWIEQAVERNSRSELAALKTNAELLTGPADELMVSFEDTVWIDGAVQDVYDFLNESQLWKDRLPHVGRVSLEENTPGLQILEMDTRTKDGSTHTTKSVRVCFAPTEIVYKQITLPALMTLHTGHWHLAADGDGMIATSQHTVVIRTENITKILGPEAGPLQARQFIHTALSTNSRATLGHAKEYAEGRR